MRLGFFSPFESTVIAARETLQLFFLPFSQYICLHLIHKAYLRQLEAIIHCLGDSAFLFKEATSHNIFALGII